MKMSHLKVRTLFGVRETVELGGGNYLLTGKNGAGKSSLLDNIKLALTNRSPRTVAIYDGADDGEVIFETDTGLSIDRRISTNKAPYSKITENGHMVPRPESFLSTIFTPLQLNPIEFMNKTPDEQNREILSLIKFDWDMDWIRGKFGEIPPGVNYDQHILKVLDDIQAENGAYFTTRQKINSDIRHERKTVEDIVATIPTGYNAAKWEAYSLADKYAELEKKRDRNGKIERAKAFQAAYDNKKRGLQADRDIAIEDQDMELNTGDWTADDFGVRKTYEDEVACSHPIWPIERLKNIDTGELKVRLAFRRGTGGRKSFNTILTDFDTVSNAKNIVSLSRIGISVQSGKRAQSLVDYIADVMDLNYDRIPETKSVSRMGWNDEGFSPYVEGVVFDGNANFGPIFNSIRPVGDYGLWRAEAWECRKYNITARLVLASSFASVLVGPLGCLPFFVHLWGMDSGTGKTVAQMLAASVWGNPTVGGPLFPTFKATSVGFEVIAGFLNSLPVIIDELQLAKDARGKINFNVYELASGSGKLRSNKTLGLVTTPTWANCFITSGETPLVGENDGAGAINRVIEIECKAETKAIQDGHRTAGILKANYGQAGKAFIEKLSEDGAMDAARQLYEGYYEECLKDNTTEKQAMAAALILTGDYLATKWVFEGDDVLTVNAIADFLKSKEAVSAADRGYNFMCDWVAQNANKLQGKAENGDVYGDMGKGVDDGWVYIIRSVFERACTEGGFSATALLSHMKSKGLIQANGKGNIKTKRINKIPTNCVVMKLKNDFEDLSDNEPTPFV